MTTFAGWSYYTAVALHLNETNEDGSRCDTLYFVYEFAAAAAK